MVNEIFRRDVLHVLQFSRIGGYATLETQRNVEIFLLQVVEHRVPVDFRPESVDDFPVEGVMAGHVLDEETSGTEFQGVRGGLGIVVKHLLQLGTIVAGEAEGFVEFIMMPRARQGKQERKPVENSFFHYHYKFDY